MPPEDNPAMDEMQHAECRTCDRTHCTLVDALDSNRPCLQTGRSEHMEATLPFKPDWALPPPGDTIKDVLATKGMSYEDFAGKINLDPDQVIRLLTGQKRITSGLAEKLHQVLGASITFWMARDLQYRTSLATAKGAEWTMCGHGNQDRFFALTIDPYVIYKMPIKVRSKITEHLGAIKLRKDGRWNWWRWTSDFHKEWSGYAQGVADHKSLAIEKVEEGWL